VACSRSSDSLSTCTRRFATSETVSVSSSSPSSIASLSAAARVRSVSAMSSRARWPPACHGSCAEETYLGLTDTE
jgi:hypothetical protein